MAIWLRRFWIWIARKCSKSPNKWRSKTRVATLPKQQLKTLSKLWKISPEFIKMKLKENNCKILIVWTETQESSLKTKQESKCFTVIKNRHLWQCASKTLWILHKCAGSNGRRNNLFYELKKTNPTNPDFSLIIEMCLSIKEMKRSFWIKSQQKNRNRFSNKFFSERNKSLNFHILKLVHTELCHAKNKFLFMEYTQYAMT